MKLSGWPLAAVILGAFASVVMLSWLRADTQIITNLLVLLGLGGGLSMLSSLRAHVNGNITQLISTLERFGNQLAQSQPMLADDSDKSTG